MKYIPLMIVTGCTSLLMAQTPEALDVKEFTLSNGLTVWLNEDHSEPKIVGAVLVKAGAKDSPNTGIPHYFEHIMFKGTEKIGTINYPEEKVYLDAIEAKYEELGKVQDAEQRASIQKEINELSIQAATYVIPNEFDRLISRYGGTRLNAGTSYDYTVYFNTFSPQYIAQWAEINSERLIDPVFRLFQSELETVYEEKNMYSDFVGSQAIEKATERYFYPHPYAYPILGSTENLKNPSLSEMRKFFEEYYVASNMGLILSGDFNTEELMPILEKTFSRIRQGEAPRHEVASPPPFNGREKLQLKVPIPVVKVMALGFRGVPADHEDQIALNIAVGLLNNANGTGFLDKLMVERKVLSSMAMNESMNDAGILGVLVVPKLLFQSYKTAEKLAWDAINRVKKGDFSDEAFQSLKREQMREYASGLEDINARTQVMMRVYSQGKSWKDYVGQVARIDAISKEDVVRVACSYFGDDYLYVTKKNGKYPKEYLPKPGYKPITPQNREASSDYARQLEEMPVKQIPPRFIEFKDVETRSLHPMATLYLTPNPVNNIFTLTLSYGVGVLEKPELIHVAGYLPLLGTDSLSFESFRNRLQVLGSTLSFEATDTDFQIRVSGFDDHFVETINLLGDFLRSAKADDKKVGQVIDEAKVMEKAFLKSSDNMAAALLEKVKYGNQSRYLTKWPLSRIKKLKGQELLNIFKDVQQVACNLHYSGTSESSVVFENLKSAIPFDRITRPSKSPYYREPLAYDKPLVYFLDMPDLSQSIIYGYVRGEAINDLESRHASKVFAGYFGGDMSSLMFQEIREFRSLAYRASAQFLLSPYNQKEKPGEFITMLSTQSDKTGDALIVLDSLIRKMPVHPERIPAVKQTIHNYINNDYPSFRKLSPRIASYVREGYESDPNRIYVESLERIDMDEVVRFYRDNIQHSQVVYLIVGSSKRIQMKQLEALGEVVKLQKKNIYR